VCRILFGPSQEELHLREVSRRAGCGFSAVHREINRLVELGLVLPRKSGNRTYFSANPSHPFYVELRALVRKSSGLREMLLDVLKGLPLKVAFVFGSEASGQARADSDVDVMVIGKTSLRELVAKTHRLQEKLGREINPHVFSVEEFRKRVKEKDHFLTTVIREPKLFLIGDEDELEGLAG
jgi:predicted nucleotidyltransferase